jgi:hypothetical protein
LRIGEPQKEKKTFGSGIVIEDAKGPEGVSKKVKQPSTGSGIVIEDARGPEGV